MSVAARASILVSGGTGSGKTTTLNALSGAIPGEERIVTIEDAAELRLRQRHVVRLEARPANLEGRGEVTIRQLVRNALRMRPDRIVVGEVRGAEALDMLQALNTGHDGSLTTVHANSPEDALRRVETLALMAGVGLPHEAVREQVGERDRPDRPPGAAAGRLAGGRVGRPRSCERPAAPACGSSTGAAASRARRDRARWRSGSRGCGGEGRRDGAPRARRLAGSAARLPRATCSRVRPGRQRHARSRRRSPGLVDAVVTAGREGRDPGAASGAGCCWRGAALAFAAGCAAAGPLGGLALGAGGPWLAARLLRARRERFRARPSTPARRRSRSPSRTPWPAATRCAAPSPRPRARSTGAAGHELRRACAELAVGAPTDDALEAMRARVRSPRLDTVVAACLLQRRAGGDLARLLRESARRWRSSRG